MKIRRIFSKILYSILLFLGGGFLSAQTITVSGYVYERGSRELLPGVTVYDAASHTAVVTNSYGFYALQIPRTDTVNVVFSGMGYANDTLQVIAAGNDYSYNPELIEITMLEEVVISDRRLTQDVQMSAVQVSAKEVKTIPILFGEKDLFKTLMLMPGVQSGTEGTSGF